MEDILHDLKAVEQDGAELGLSLSHQKSEVIFIVSNTRATVLSCFPDIQVVDPENATILGCQITGLSSISK